jgi:hypothetical protein
MIMGLSGEEAEALESVASVEGRPVSDIIRAAISQHIDTRRKDPDFQQGLRQRTNIARRLLER